MSNKNPSQKEDMLGRCMIFGTQIWKMEFSGDLLMQLIARSWDSLYSWLHHAFVAWISLKVAVSCWK